MIKKVTIIGTGAYGTALANVLSDNNADVVMFGVEQKQVDDINDNHRNSFFFKDMKINSQIKATTNLASAIDGSQLVILSVPTVAIENVIDQIINVSKSEFILLNVAKGLDGDNTDVLSKKIKQKLLDSHNQKNMGYAGLYGPSVASEVLERKPTIVMCASDDIDVATKIADLFTNDYFVVKPTENLIGTEISAAVKNTIAIAAGMIHGIDCADNTQASLITQGLLEMIELSKAYGASEKDLINYGSVGDLILTTTSPKTRNYTLGLEIAKLDDAKAVLDNYKFTVEGVLTCKIAYEMAKKVNINLPLIEIMYKVLYNNGKPSLALNDLFKSLGINRKNK